MVSTVPPSFLSVTNSTPLYILFSRSLIFGRPIPSSIFIGGSIIIDYYLVEASGCLVRIVIFSVSSVKYTTIFEFDRVCSNLSYALLQNVILPSFRSSLFLLRFGMSRMRQSSWLYCSCKPAVFSKSDYITWCGIAKRSPEAPKKETSYHCLIAQKQGKGYHIFIKYTYPF